MFPFSPHFLGHPEARAAALGECSTTNNSAISGDMALTISTFHYAGYCPMFRKYVKRF
jgi:hypothetical protein